MVMFL